MTALYRHFDRSGRLLYVGVSDNPAERLAQHRAQSEWAGAIERQSVVWFCSRPLALAAEKDAINDERPPYNERLNPDAKGESRFFKTSISMPNDLAAAALQKCHRERRAFSTYLQLLVEQDLAR